MNNKVDIHGSCVSFSIFKKETEFGDNWVLQDVENNLFIDHVNHASCFTDPLNIDIDKYKFQGSEHWIRNYRIDLTKTATQILDDSDATWLMIDLYAMARAQIIYNGGCFSLTQGPEEIFPELWADMLDQIEGNFRWINLPSFIWKEKIDHYMEWALKRYGSDHIILNRVNYSKYFIDNNNALSQVCNYTSEQAYGGSGDNEAIRRMEDYIVNKWPVHSIDVAKYYVADYNFAHDVVAVHYERDYYRLAGDAVRSIIVNGPSSSPITIEKPDLSALRFKLNQNNLLCQSDIDYLSCTTSPFNLYEPLDEIVNTVLDNSQIRRFSDTLIRMYEDVFANPDYYNSPSVSKQDKQEHLIDLFEELTAM